MTEPPYLLRHFLDDLRRTVAETSDEQAILARLRPLALRLAKDRAWLKPDHYEYDGQQGYGVHVLHEEPNHDLAIFAVAWAPGKGAPPHDHGTWSVFAPVDGPEHHIFWRRVDDRRRPGYAELERAGERVVEPGQTFAMLTPEIHSIVNDTDGVALSLHVYGRHVNFTKRSKFDPERRLEEAYVSKTS